jgi:hypothetical protein
LMNHHYNCFKSSISSTYYSSIAFHCSISFTLLYYYPPYVFAPFPSCYQSCGQRCQKPTSFETKIRQNTWVATI